MQDEFFNEALLETTADFVSDKNYMILCAAFDMFPSSNHSTYRVGTITTSYRDCGALGLIGAFASKIGMTPATAAALVFYPLASQEIDKFLQTIEEITKKDSYLPYCRSMSIVDKSPFSISKSIKLHSYIMFYLSLSGDKRGLNSVLMDDVNNDAILHLVIRLHLHLQGADTITRQFYMDRQDLDDHDNPDDLVDGDDGASSVDLDDVGEGSVPQSAYRSEGNSAVIKDHIRSYRKRVEAASREGSIGLFIKTTLTAWESSPGPF